VIQPHNAGLTPPATNQSLTGVKRFLQEGVTARGKNQRSESFRQAQ